MSRFAVLRLPSPSLPTSWPKLRVTTIDSLGQGYDLTHHVEALVWSNVDPGGDEVCSFRLKRSWFANAPEVAQGNMLRVTDSLDTLWQGRIEENDRAVSNAEEIGVTAYGTGIRLRDGRMREIYCDRTFSSWRGPSIQRQKNLIAGFHSPVDPGVGSDVSNNSPALVSAVTGDWNENGQPDCTAVYDGSGIAIGSLSYAWNKGANIVLPDADWFADAILATDDAYSSYDAGQGNLFTAVGAGPGTGTNVATTVDRTFATVRLYWTQAPGFGTAGTPGIQYQLFWSVLAVYGRHNVPQVGSLSATSAPGFYVSDIVRDAVGRVAGIQTRRVEQSPYVIYQCTFRDPTAHENVVREMARYDSVNWGTWAGGSLFDLTTDGFFDWRRRNDSIATWTTLREDCESVDLQVELAGLADQAQVAYTDLAGQRRVEVRTTDVPLFDAAEPPIHRTVDIDGGTSTQADAQLLGDTALALSGTHPPARGSVTHARPITHYLRGRLPAHHMRANGANLRVPDVFPLQDVFGLTADADRRTTFPIQRVEVDAGGGIPKARVDVDQRNDLLSILQARLSQDAALVG